MGQPMVNYPPRTTFGTRIRDMAAEKKQVAEYVVKKFLLEGAAGFISDGSSTFYVGLELLQYSQRFKKRGRIVNTKMFTNNLAIAHEYALWNSPVGEIGNVKAYCTGGDVNSDLMMVYGDQAKDMAEKVAKDGPFLVLAVRAIFGKEGPAGLDKEADVKIKVAALKAGSGITQGVIFVADHKKLSTEFGSGMPLLYPIGSGYWQELMDRQNTYIISSKYPNVDPQVPPPSSSRTPEINRYLNNWNILHASMGKRFIEV